MGADASKTVLVVEDEVFIRIVAADVLSESGFSVIEAGDAAEALAVLAAHPEVAVLFTDINMPGEMDGLALARHVAEIRPEIRIVVTSGRHWLSQDKLPQQGRFLPKPYRGDDLTHVVTEQLNNPPA